MVLAVVSRIRYGARDSNGTPSTSSGRQNGVHVRSDCSGAGVFSHTVEVKRDARSRGYGCHSKKEQCSRCFHDLLSFRLSSELEYKNRVEQVSTGPCNRIAMDCQFVSLRFDKANFRK